MSVFRASRPFMLMQKRQAKPDVPSRLRAGSGTRHATAGNMSSNSASVLLSMSQFLRLCDEMRLSLGGLKPISTQAQISFLPQIKSFADQTVACKSTQPLGDYQLTNAGFSTGKPRFVRIYLAGALAPQHAEAEGRPWKAYLQDSQWIKSGYLLSGTVRWRRRDDHDLYFARTVRLMA